MKVSSLESKNNGQRFFPSLMATLLILGSGCAEKSQKEKCEDIGRHLNNHEQMYLIDPNTLDGEVVKRTQELVSFCVKVATIDKPEDLKKAEPYKDLAEAAGISECYEDLKCDMSKTIEENFRKKHNALTPSKYCIEAFGDIPNISKRKDNVGFSAAVVCSDIERAGKSHSWSYWTGK